MEIVIPGGKTLRIEHLVLDYNGTLAQDGELLMGVTEKLTVLAKHLKVHVITADTYGKVQEKLKDVPCALTIIGSEEQDRQKSRYIEELGSGRVTAVGNGRNDVLMLQNAALGICLIQGEGASGVAIGAADIVCTNILDALDLLIRTARLQATLRN
ncbi:MAG: ATPase P [Pseudomonadota bacterium]